MKTFDKSEPIFLAADSGGTKTDWRFLNSRGELLKKVMTPGMASVHPGMLPVMEYASEAKSAFPEGKIKRVYFSLGGPNVQEITETLQALWQDSEITVEREASGDLAESCRNVWNYNAVVMGGTGVTAMGFQADGSRKFAEGWGPVTGDFGSGGSIGLTAVQTFLRGIDGTGESGRLPELFSEMLRGLDLRNFPERMELKQRINSLDRRALAALVPDVMRLAEEGDAVSLKIIRQSAVNMAQLAAAVAPENGVVLMLGGLFKAGEFYRELCRKELAKLRSDCRWLREERCTIGTMASARVLMLEHINITSTVWENIIHE